MKRKGKKKNPLVKLVLPVKKVEPIGGQSEVGNLLRQINQEYQAAQWGLSGLAYGVSQHAFITARMEKIEDARGQLVELVGGEDEATRMVVEQLARSKEEREGS